MIFALSRLEEVKIQEREKIDFSISVLLVSLSLLKHCSNYS